MEFFGITQLGPQNYIKDTMKEFYKEPMNVDEVKPMVQKVLENDTFPKTFERPDLDVIRTIDCYIGRVNGFAYGSLTRFDRMKTKGVVKYVYPGDIYRITPTTNIEHGWFYNDPALYGKVWYKVRPRHPAVYSEMTKLLDTARKNDKYASLY